MRVSLYQLAFLIRFYFLSRERYISDMIKVILLIDNKYQYCFVIKRSL